MSKRAEDSRWLGANPIPKRPQPDPGVAVASSFAAQASALGKVPPHDLAEIVRILTCPVAHEFAAEGYGRNGLRSGLLRASETGILSAAELTDAQRSMTAEQYAQEYECSFDAAIIGAYYAKQIAKLRADNFRAIDERSAKTLFVIDPAHFASDDLAEPYACRVMDAEIPGNHHGIVWVMGNRRDPAVRPKLCDPRRRDACG